MANGTISGRDFEEGVFSAGDRARKEGGGWYDPHDAVGFGKGDYAKYPANALRAQPYGWICTRCGASNAPYVSRCACRPAPKTRRGGKST